MRISTRESGERAPSYPRTGSTKSLTLLRPEETPSLMYFMNPARLGSSSETETEETSSSELRS